MTKLEELTQELCPNGVTYLRLEDIAQYCKNRINASMVNAFAAGDILIGNIRPYLKKIWLADCDGGTNGDVLAIHIIDTRVRPEFLYYVLSSDSFFHYDMQNSKGSKMPRGSKEAVMRYSIPVPPLPVQREIVRILDNFTELTAELTAELTTRRKQYEYYRDLLLTFNDVNATMFDRQTDRQTDKDN